VRQLMIDQGCEIGRLRTLAARCLLLSNEVEDPVDAEQLVLWSREFLGVADSLERGAPWPMSLRA
jgi:hypothetical protein